MEQYINSSGTVDLFAALNDEVPVADLAKAKAEWISKNDLDNSNLLSRYRKYVMREHFALLRKNEAEIGTALHKGMNYEYEFYKALIVEVTDVILSRMADLKFALELGE